MSIDRWARHITILVGRWQGLDAKEQEIVQYGLTVLISSLVGLILVAGTAWTLGLLYPTLMVVAAAGSLRISAGGAHCSAPWRCNLLGIMVFPVLGYVAAFSAVLPVTGARPLFYPLLGAAAAVVFSRAPVLTPNKPLSEVKKGRLRFRSRLTVLLLVVVAVILWETSSGVIAAGMAIGLVWQAFTLLPLGWRLVGAFDSWLTCRAGN